MESGRQPRLTRVRPLIAARLPVNAKVGVKVIKTPASLSQHSCLYETHDDAEHASKEN